MISHPNRSKGRRFEMRVTMDNVTFDDSPVGELARILRDTADRLEAGDLGARLFDINGNVVGQFACK